MSIPVQMGFEDVSQEYAAFVDKFKLKKTTDDCYTPPNIYEAVLGWVRKEYKIPEDAPIVRPFYPGEDYTRAEYPDGCYVVDNPPFSIVSQICKHYAKRGIRYFLFCPYLTCLGIRADGVCAIPTDNTITYENGAIVPTAFVTNLDTVNRIRSAPDLYAVIDEAEKENRTKEKGRLPKYAYPDAVCTASMVGRYSRLGVPFAVARDECWRIPALDAQRGTGKDIFGGGLLLSERAAAERAAAERAAAERAAAERARVHRWQLSDRERQMQQMLGRKDALQKEGAK